MTKKSVRTPPRLQSSLLSALIISAGSLAIIGGQAAQAAPNVVVSISPIHSLVAAVMGEAGTPNLLIEGAGSPHGYQLKPSQAANLQNADVIFWIGPELESFLEKTLGTVAGKAKSVALIDASDVHHLSPRPGGNFDAHNHEDEHGHDADHGAEHESGHDDSAAHDHENEEDHAENEHHHNEAIDPHVWLDPHNAKIFIRTIAETLSVEDPANAAIYSSNAATEIERLDVMSKEITARLAPVRDKPYVVFHDAYQYFEHSFDFKATGSITVNPEIKPGAERVGEIHAKLTELQAACVFAEPQFEPKIIKVVTEGTNARSGVLDPLGAELKPGPELYHNLLSNMADAFVECLSDQ